MPNDADRQPNTSEDENDFLAKFSARATGAQVPGSPLDKLQLAKPNDQNWFQAHPDREFSHEFHLLKDEYSETTYLVLPHVAEEANEPAIKLMSLRLYITVKHCMGLWPIGITDNTWHKSAHEVYEKAKCNWVRLVNGGGRWIAKEMSVEGAKSQGEPMWPDELTMAKILISAFGDNKIETLDHDVLRNLRGDGPRK